MISKEWHKLFEVTIRTLPHLKCTRLFTVRSSHLPIKMHWFGFRVSLPCIDDGARIELTCIIWLTLFRTLLFLGVLIISLQVISNNT